MIEKEEIAVLFDFDGVVMDTETQYSIFWGELGKEYHPEIENFERVIKGQTMGQIFDGYFKGMDSVQEQIMCRLDKFENEMEYNYISGVLDFITDLRANGVKIAVVTSSSLLKMEKVYRVHPELPTLFDAILTANMFKKSKPNPECFLLGADMLGALPRNSFVFEDSFHGLKAGNAANMNVIGLATTNSFDAICDKAHLVIDDFTNFTFEQMMLVQKI